MEGAATYLTRFVQMWDQCGPGSWRFLLHSREEVARAPKASPLHIARCHPDTGSIIPLPFCMAAHVPVNACLLLGMLTARTPLSTGAWQSLNQLFNAAQFFANRNASNQVSDARLGASLAASLASAVAVASGLQIVCARLQLQGSALQLVIPFLGAAAAKPLQIGLLRSDELSQGVEVFDGAGTPQGRSAVAGRLGVSATIFTRILYLAPMLWMPFVQHWMEKRAPVLRSNRALGLGVYLVHAAFNSSVVTPACIALFEQRQAIKASALEERFHGAGDEILYFNKGL